MPIAFLNVIVACLHVLFGRRRSSPLQTAVTRIALMRAEARSIALLAHASHETAQRGSRSLKGKLVPHTAVHELQLRTLRANHIDT